MAYGDLIGRAGANPPPHAPEDLSALIREQVGGRTRGSAKIVVPKRKPMAMKKKSIKTTGSFEGQSNKLGYGGRAAQLKAKGVPGGVIGDLARKAGTAPGMPNYHGPKAKGKK